MNVVLDLEAIPEGLGHGYRVYANFVIWSSQDALKVGIGALFRQAGEWVVFVRKDDRVEIRPVKLGQMNDEYAQVLEGLTEGDQVVLYPNDRLESGSLIDTRR